MFAAAAGSEWVMIHTYLHDRQMFVMRDKDLTKRLA